MKKLIFAFLLIGGLILLGAFRGGLLGTGHKKTVTLTVWHTFVEQMDEHFNVLVREFNDTIGAKEGIVVSVAADANLPSLNEMLLAAARRDPGAQACPDLAYTSPRIAIQLAKMGALSDLGTLFTKDELDRYVPSFLEEGMLGGDTLYMFPVTRSTVVLYVNRTLFDRFAADVGCDMSLFATFEGILEASEKYYEWTDAQTPEIPDDGKTFYYPDAAFYYTMIGFEQLGDHFLKDCKPNFDSPVWARIWDSYFPYAVRGRVAIFDKYASYLAATGDIVCATSTSAGAMFYPHTVMYDDNTKEDVTFDVLPCPVFEGGERVTAQFGVSMCVLKPDAEEPEKKERERAAALFLKWFTEPAQNLRFTASTGYMPVMQEAFDFFLTHEPENIEDEYVRKSLQATLDMQRNYRFYVSPMFNGFDALRSRYMTRLINAAQDAREEYEKLRGTDSSEAFDFSAKMRNFVEGF